MELVDFLRARYDEVAARAEAAPPGPWNVEASGSIVDANGAKVIGSVGGVMDGRVSRWPEGPAAEHIIGNDPARALADIEVKRQVVSDYEKAAFTLSVAEPGTPPHDLMTGATNTLARTLRLLARPFRAHPDFDPAWLED